MAHSGGAVHSGSGLWSATELGFASCPRLLLAPILGKGLPVPHCKSATLPLSYRYCEDYRHSIWARSMHEEAGPRVSTHQVFIKLNETTPWRNPFMTGPSFGKILLTRLHLLHKYTLISSSFINQRHLIISNQRFCCAGDNQHHTTLSCYNFRQKFRNMICCFRVFVTASSWVNLSNFTK